MSRSRVGFLLVVSLLLAACDTACPYTGGAPNTTYQYEYVDTTGAVHTGTITTDGQGNATVPNVPENFDCGRISFSQTTIGLEAPPQA